MNRHIALGPADHDESRPFAYVAHNAADLAALEKMAARLLQLIGEHDQGRGLKRFHPYLLHTAEGRWLRMVVNQPEALQVERDLALVGFFGHRRPVVPPEVDVDKDTIDLELIADFPEHSGVLAYCSMALDDANFGNLVLMAGPEINEQWNTSARHAYASRVIAPRYYTSVRLHNGVLPGGLRSGQAPVLLRTKYYDYSGDWPWAAVREYAQA